MTQRAPPQSHFQLGDQSGLVGAVLVVVLLFLGFALLAGLRNFGPVASLNQQTVTQRNIDAVQSSFHSFLTRNSRLPCPANGNTPQGSSLNGIPEGIEDCTNASGQSFGVLPWQTLGILPAQALDGYNNRLGYAVSSNLTNGAPYQNGGTPTPSPAIQLCSGSASCSSPVQYAYLVISYGRDGAGAYMTSGKQQAVITGTAEYPNTQAAAFSGTGNFVMYPYCNDSTCPTSTNSANLFDDALVYETSTQLQYDFTLGTSGAAAANKQARQTQMAAQLAQTAGTKGLTAGDTAGLAGNANNMTVSSNLGGTGVATAASMTNPLAFSGCSGNSCVSAGTTTNGVTTASLTLNGGLGTVTVSGANTGGISTGNSALNAIVDSIGANNTASCLQCPYNSINPNYMIPGQTLTYAFNVSFTSFAFVDYLVNGGMTVQVTGYLSATPTDQTSWVQVGQLNISNGPYTDNLHTAQNFNPACLGPAQADAWPEAPTPTFPTLAFPLSPSWLQSLQPTFTSYIPQNNADPNENLLTAAGGVVAWPTGFPPPQLSQQWPTVSFSQGISNYNGAFDNQFSNRKFVDLYGNALSFNILQFQLLPYVDSNGVTDTPNASGQYNDAMFFEGLKACPTYPAGTITVGGSPGSGDTIALTFVNSGIASLMSGETVQYTVSSSDTTTTIAAGLAAAINSDAVLTNATIRANNYTSTGEVGASVTIVDEAGAIPTIDTVLSASVSGGTAIGALSTTVTVGGSPPADEILSLTFTNAVPGETVHYTVSASDTTSTIAVGLIAAINNDAVLRAASISASSLTSTSFAIVDSGSLPVVVNSSNSAVVAPGFTLSTATGANVCDMQGSVSYPPPGYTPNTTNAPGDQWWNPPTYRTMDCSLQNGLSLQ